jgi:hypothetical protein
MLQITYKVEKDDQVYIMKNNHQTFLLIAWTEKLCSLRKHEDITAFHMTHATSTYVL